MAVDAIHSSPRPLEPAAWRAFKGLMLASGAIAAATIAGKTIAAAGGLDVGTVAMAGAAAPFAIHLTFERIKSVMVGRGRLGVDDGLVRRLAQRARAVARQEADGAWVVLMGTSTVKVMDKREFEAFATDCAKRWPELPLNVLWSDGGCITVERWQAGAVRDGDTPSRDGSAYEFYSPDGVLKACRRATPPFPAPEGLRMQVAADGRLEAVDDLGPVAPGLSV
jgi:hypothetical protein